MQCEFYFSDGYFIETTKNVVSVVDMCRELFLTTVNRPIKHIMMCASIVKTYLMEYVFKNYRVLACGPIYINLDDSRSTRTIYYDSFSR